MVWMPLRWCSIWRGAEVFGGQNVAFVASVESKEQQSRRLVASALRAGTSAVPGGWGMREFPEAVTTKACAPGDSSPWPQG